MKNGKVILPLIACIGFAAATAQASDKNNGKKVYDTKCAMCHGKDAKGNATMQKSMKLSAGALNLTDKDSAEFVRITENGQDKMPAFKDKLKTSDIEDTAAYVASLTPAASKSATPAKPSGDLSAAKKLYNTKCASCHGKEGKGNAGLAKTLKLDPAALDLTAKTTLEKKDEELSAVTKKGQGKMPAYADKLSDAEIENLTSYIRSMAPKQ